MGEMLAKGFRMLDGRKFHIRHAQVTDAKELLLYIKTVIAHSPYLLFEAEEYEGSLAQQQQQIQQMLDHPSSLALVAVYEQEIIGMLNFKCGRRKKLEHAGNFGMSVSRTYRGLGVGKTLLSNLIVWGRQHPVLERIELEVVSKNRSAIHLYESAGFEIEGVKRRAVKNSYGEYDDIILMSFFVDRL